MPQPCDTMCGQDYTLRGDLLAKDGAPEFWDKMHHRFKTRTPGYNMQHCEHLQDCLRLEKQGDTSTASIIPDCVRALCTLLLECKYNICK